MVTLQTYLLNSEEGLLNAELYFQSEEDYNVRRTYNMMFVLPNSNVWFPIRQLNNENSEVNWQSHKVQVANRSGQDSE